MQSIRSNTRWRLVTLALLVLFTTAPCLRASALAAHSDKTQPFAAMPDLQVDFLGAEKGFATGAQSVTVLCVIRNMGAAALPENAARVRCYPLSGLDFMDGQLWPLIPALGPNQAVAFRWRLAVADQTTPLVFSVLISRDGRSGQDADINPPRGPRVAQMTPDPAIAPRLAAISIPRFASAPHLLGDAAPARTPQALSAPGTASVGNDRSLVRVLAAQDHVPVLVLAGKDGADWKNVAVGVPCIQVRSAEDGEVPWWESFHWAATDIENQKDTASLVLHGSVGANWTARLTLESRLDTGVIYGKLHLTARRTVRIHGVQLPRLLAAPPGGAATVRADGSAEILRSDFSPVGDQERISAAHSGALTFGLAWPAAAPLAGWRASRMPPGDIDHLPALGVEWGGDDRGEVILAGASIEMPFRIFVFGPSDTVRDALRFRIP